MATVDFAIGIGGENGQGIASTGDILARIFARRGLHLNAYNAYQSIIRGGHTFLTIRTGPEKVTNMGDRIDLLIPLNQDAVNRHLGLLTDGAACIYNADTIKPGAAADRVRLCAYPMSPSTGVLHWMAAHARKAGIMVRQVEDEIGVVNMAIGAAHAGVRSMCATSGGGFALMSEGLGMSAMMETPVVVIDCQRAGPSTGVPTKTEQGDLWQMLGAAFGDYPRVIAAPLDIGDCFKIIPEIFNIADRFQCPGIVLCDLLLSEGRLSVDPKDLDFNPVIDRGELVISANGAPSEDGTNGAYKRYRITESGISPRAIPGVPGHIHTAATDEHDEDGVLISDEFTNPIKRRAMMEKRMRKVVGIEAAVPPPSLWGPRDADVTLIGWGSTKGVIEEACEILSEQGISANQLQIRWLVPLHGEAILDILKDARHTIIVENNYSGQFARYLRSETSYVPSGYIRKYDGEPFMQHHIVEAVKEQLSGKTKLSVPAHEIMV